MNSQIYNLLNDGGDHKGRRSSLAMVSLRDFLHEYGVELFNYYGEDFYVKGDEEVWPSEYTEGCESDSMILCMADTCEDKKVITKKSARKSLRRAGSERRRRMEILSRSHFLFPSSCGGRALAAERRRRR